MVFSGALSLLSQCGTDCCTTDYAELHHNELQSPVAQQEVLRDERKPLFGLAAVQQAGKRRGEDDCIRACPLRLARPDQAQGSRGRTAAERESVLLNPGFKVHFRDPKSRSVHIVSFAEKRDDVLGFVITDHAMCGCVRGKAAGSCVFVSKVVPGSFAAERCVRTGWIVEKIVAPQVGGTRVIKDLDEARYLLARCKEPLRET